MARSTGLIRLGNVQYSRLGAGRCAWGRDKFRSHRASGYILSTSDVSGWWQPPGCVYCAQSVQHRHRGHSNINPAFRRGEGCAGRVGKGAKAVALLISFLPSWWRVKAQTIPLSANVGVAGTSTDLGEVSGQALTPSGASSQGPTIVQPRCESLQYVRLETAQRYLFTPVRRHRQVGARAGLLRKNRVA